MTGPLVVVGDILLDRDLLGRVERLCPDAPVPVVEDVEACERPGGAGLAALLAARDGRPVVLVTALAEDAGAARLRELLGPHVEVVALPMAGRTPEKSRVRADGQSLLRLDSGGAPGLIGDVPAEVGRLLAGAGGVLVADYGRGMAAHPGIRTLLAGLPPRVPVVWDPHPRGAQPVPGGRLATPNSAEAGAFAGRPREAADGIAEVGADAAALVRRWGLAAVAVTLGARGALLSFADGTPMILPARRVANGDACGAGDRFAATAAGLLADGALTSEAVQGAVEAATAFVAAGGAGAVSTSPRPRRRPAGGVGADGRGEESAAEVIARTRAAGGTVVATGGCFDLLHAGHVSLLTAARSLGDCLVVCLNSDASVRRLKGPDRPLVAEDDRARVLAALECVDAVAVFDEDTPVAVLDRLRPDIWAKGGDYGGVHLPESDVLAGWGGQAVVLPYLDGRSTTGLVRAAAGVRDR